MKRSWYSVSSSHLLRGICLLVLLSVIGCASTGSQTTLSCITTKYSARDSAEQVLLKDYDTALKQLSYDQREIDKMGKRYSGATLSMSGAGIASGIAATSLAVASPANAAVVAGLTGFGSGMAAFQTMYADEGFARDYYEKWAQSIDENRKAVSVQIHDKLTAGIDSQEKFSSLCMLICDLRYVRDTTPKPTIVKSGEKPQAAVPLVLLQLQQLLSQNAITQAEYDAKKKAILDSIK